MCSPPPPPTWWGAAGPDRTAARGRNDGHGDRTVHIQQALGFGTARTVILFIGDGMGDSEITLARKYPVGAAGRLTLDQLPLTGAADAHGEGGD